MDNILHTYKPLLATNKSLNSQLILATSNAYIWVYQIILVNEFEQIMLLKKTDCEMCRLKCRLFQSPNKPLALEPEVYFIKETLGQVCNYSCPARSTKERWPWNWTDEKQFIALFRYSGRASDLSIRLMIVTSFWTYHRLVAMISPDLSSRVQIVKNGYIWTYHNLYFQTYWHFLNGHINTSFWTYRSVPETKIWTITVMLNGLIIAC